MANGTSVSYSYDDNGNTTVTKFGNESLVYDANGNRISDEKYKYTWNEADQLIAITKQGESTPFATYKYDDDGRRIEKTVDGKTTRYHYERSEKNHSKRF